MHLDQKKTSVSLGRFFWVPTKHCVLRNIPYIRNSMLHIFYLTYADASMYQGSSCRGFILLLQLLKSRNSVFASSANMSKLLLLLRWFLAKMRRLWNRQTVPYYFCCWWRPWRDVFPRVSTLFIHSPFGKDRIYGEKRHPFSEKFALRHIDFCDNFDILVGKINK